VLECRTIIDIGSIAISTDDESEVVEKIAQLATHNPSVIGLPFLIDLSLAPTFPDRMQQFNAVGIDDTDHGWISHEDIDISSVGVDLTKQPCSRPQVRKERSKVASQPSPESTLSTFLQRVEHSDGDYFGWMQTDLCVFGIIAHCIIYTTEQFCDKIYGGHGTSS